MKVIHVIGALVAGGAERFVVDLVLEIGRTQHDISLLVLSNRMDQAGRQLHKRLENAGVRCLCGPTNRVGIRSVIWYINALHEEAPDIVHLHTPNTEQAHFFAVPLFRRRHHIFRTVHNTVIPKTLGCRVAMRMNHAKMSIACSDATYEKFKTKIKGDMVTVQNGVSFNWPVQTQELKEAYKARLMLDVKQFHFLAIGSQSGETLMTAQKAHDVLLRSWQRGGLGTLGAQLHLLGDGTLKEQLKALAKGDQSVNFHGVKGNVHDWIVAADCFVMPSRFEGLPIAGIEAVGTGLPCIFSDIPPLRELGASAVSWIPVDDVDALAKMLVETRFNGIVRERNDVCAFREKFGIARTAREYLTHYARCEGATQIQ